MLNKKNKVISSILIVLFLAATFVTYLAPDRVQAQTKYDNLVFQAVKAQYDSCQNGAAVNGGGYVDFSAYDAYILETAGADVNTWVYDNTSLKTRVVGLIDATIANAADKSAKRIAQDYLAAKAWGETDRASQLLAILKSRQTESGFDNNTFSDIPAFELLGRSGDLSEINTTNAITYILANQDATGAWTPAWNDFQTTAQAVRALYYLKNQPGVEAEVQATIQTAVDNAMNWMKGVQKDDGSFQDAGGFDYKITDTAEVIYTLKLLGTDPSTWETAGKSPVHYMTENALAADGFGNIGCTTAALDAYLQLGGSAAADRVLGLKVTPPGGDIHVNEYQQFTATAYKVNGDTEDVSASAAWSTEDPAIAVINNTGLLTGMAAGSTVAAAVYEGITAGTNVTIRDMDGGGPGGQNNSITVNIAVVGKDGNLLYRPGSVQISKDGEFGLTAMSALASTGLNYELSNRNDGMVVSIAGEANKGMNGWCGKVNNTSFWDIPKQIAVTQGDNIIFWYSTNADFNGPNWDDLLSGNVYPTMPANAAKEKMKETLNSYREELDNLLKAVASNSVTSDLKLLNQDQKMTQDQVRALAEETDRNKTALSEAVGSVETVLGDNEVSMLVPENALSQTVNLTINELDPGSEQHASIKLGSSVYEFGPAGARFDKPVTISLRVPITEDLDTEYLTPAWYDEKNSQWIPIPGVIDLQTGLVVFQIDHFTKFALIEIPEPVPKDRITFTDVNEDIAWAKEAIEILAGKGIIKGRGIGFEPQREITRAEFTQMIVQALALKGDASTNKNFNDIEAGAWYAKAVAAAYQNGIIKGYPDRSFKPAKFISRNEVSIIFRGMSSFAPPDEEIVKLSFRDAGSIPDWALSSIQYAVSKGLMTGYEDQTFRGDNHLTRAEAAVILYRYMSLQNKL